MRTILLNIEYDGTAYAGWQIQPNILAVQEVVESALTQILGQEVRIHSSGRTDAGVHARSMMVHFQTESNIPLQAFREGVNGFLPVDIAIREAREMPEGFHARYSAKGKWYRYTIYNNDVRSPLAARTSWHLRGSLDLDMMRTAAESLVGKHDFQAFRSSGCVAKTSVREIFQVDVFADQEFVYIDIKGSGFLRNMVRIIAGTLVEVGQGRRPASDLPELLRLESRLSCGPTAPAHGLCLQEVWY
ncbi:MAG: tRNA pseudouridine(38-40) synthase TruA [Deltaproteobacteria bacterium]|nr:MAG: tRNA pseudouridine(38-40) synthase TruA [Deltaproteobacteria bacterium]